MINKKDFEEIFYSEEEEKNIKEFMKSIRARKINADGSYNNVKKILKGMEYRPDKVAEYYLGNFRMSWIIDLANDFTNGIKDYYLGREIVIPNINEAEAKLLSYIES